MYPFSASHSAPFKKKKKKQTDNKIYVCKILNNFCPRKELKDYRANSIDPEEVAHHEPPHLDPCCLQI